MHKTLAEGTVKILTKESHRDAIYSIQELPCSKQN